MMIGSSGGYGGGGSSSKGYEESMSDTYGQSHPAPMMMMTYGGGSGGSQGAPMMMNFADSYRMMQSSGGRSATHEYALEMLPHAATDMGEQYADSNHQPATMTMNDRMQTSDGQQQVNNDHDSTISNHILGGSGGLNLASAALPQGMNALEAHFQLQPDRRRRRRR